MKALISALALLSFVGASTLPYVINPAEAQTATTTKKKASKKKGVKKTSSKKKTAKKKKTPAKSAS